MTLGSSFTAIRDGEWLEHTVVWTGCRWLTLIPLDPSQPSASSLLADGQGQAPAKSTRSGGGITPVRRSGARV